MFSSCLLVFTLVILSGSFVPGPRTRSESHTVTLIKFHYHDHAGLFLSACRCSVADIGLCMHFQPVKHRNQVAWIKGFIVFHQIIMYDWVFAIFSFISVPWPFIRLNQSMFKTSRHYLIVYIADDHSWAVSLVEDTLQSQLTSAFTSPNISSCRHESCIY